MPPAKDEGAHELVALIRSNLDLLEQFVAALNPANDADSDTASPIANPPNPLRVLSDAAKLVKAHTTKISLLAINKPFTPSAISKIVKELAATCLPAMMSAAQVCQQRKADWGGMMCKEVHMRVRRVFRELDVLLNEILSFADGGTVASNIRDSLSSTGVVWESCDALVELESMGISGLAVRKVREYRDTIKDAIQELQDWVEGDDLDTEGRGDGLLDSEDEGVAGDKDSIDDIFNAANSMPNDRPELKALTEEADGKLKKVVILYNALEKRRIATFNRSGRDDKPAEHSVGRLDELMLHLRRMPHQVDEMASYLYDLDESGARDILSKCLTEARMAGKSMDMDWEGKEDVFTTWLRKWESAVS